MSTGVWTDERAAQLTIRKTASLLKWARLNACNEPVGGNENGNTRFEMLKLSFACFLNMVHNEFAKGDRPRYGMVLFTAGAVDPRVQISLRRVSPQTRSCRVIVRPCTSMLGMSAQGTSKTRRRNAAMFPSI